MALGGVPIGKRKAQEQAAVQGTSTNQVAVGAHGGSRGATLAVATFETRFDMPDESSTASTRIV